MPTQMHTRSTSELVSLSMASDPVLRWTIDIPRYAKPITVKRNVMPLVLAAMGSSAPDVTFCRMSAPPAGGAWRIAIGLSSTAPVDPSTPTSSQWTPDEPKWSTA